MFVRAKQQSGRSYYYLVTNARQGRKVHQRTLAYLGEYPSVEAALTGLSAHITRHQHEALKYYAGAAAAKRQLPPNFIEENHWCSRNSPASYHAKRYQKSREAAEFHQRRSHELHERLSKLKALIESGSV